MEEDKTKNPPVEDEPKDIDEKEPEKFDPSKMSDEMKEYVANQIAIAVKTTKENAEKDPTLIEKIKKSLEDESNKTTEQRLEEKLAELNRKEAKIEARDIFTKNGIPDELVETYVSLSLTDTLDKTVEKANSLVEAYNKAFSKGKDTGLENQKKNLNPPPTDGGKTKTKTFKEMSMEERLELKKNNPQKFEDECRKLMYKF